MKAFLKQMNSVVRCSFSKKKSASFFMVSLVRRTLATSPRVIQLDQRQAPLPLWLSEAFRVARVAKGEPAGARFATRPDRTTIVATIG